jgi:hypothetical protein
LYDITSLYPSPEFSKIQNDTYGDWSAFGSFNATNPSFVQQLESKYGIAFSGQLYYIVSSNGDLNPVVQFSNPTVPNARVIAEVSEAIASPVDVDSNIDWQEMTGLTGQLATTIFQVFTQGGKPVGVSASVSISRSATAGRN